MKPYTGDATCPKCKTKWTASLVNRTYCNGKNCPLPLPDDWLEHLHCKCKGCGFEWLMECADAGPDIMDGVQLICDKLDDYELAAMALCAVRGGDPREHVGWGRAKSLFSLTFGTPEALPLVAQYMMREAVKRF